MVDSRSSTQYGRPASLEADIDFDDCFSLMRRPVLSACCVLTTKALSGDCELKRQEICRREALQFSQMQKAVSQQVARLRFEYRGFITDGSTRYDSWSAAPRVVGDVFHAAYLLP